MGAQGLDKVERDTLAIADSPAEFVATTVRLLNDSAERQRRSHCGRSVIERHYSWQALGQQFANFCQTMLHQAATSQ